MYKLHKNSRIFLCKIFDQKLLTKRSEVWYNVNFARARAPARRPRNRKKPSLGFSLDFYIFYKTAVPVVVLDNGFTFRCKDVVCGNFIFINFLFFSIDFYNVYFLHNFYLFFFIVAVFYGVRLLHQSATATSLLYSLSVGGVSAILFAKGHSRLRLA